nr:hypothetical protein GCM10020092_041790 [Actinoplanes digitatis]
MREFGTNNMPDCSNMCHEASGRALIAAIGTGKGTCDLDDWESADLLILMAVNAASNAPRMLTSLAAAARRGAEIVHVNPLIEAASKRTIVPHDFASMATMRATKTGTMNVQPRIGGDLALLRGLAKVVLEQNAVDQEFIEAHTDAYDAYRKLVDDTEWDDIVHQSGVAEEIIRDLAEPVHRVAAHDHRLVPRPDAAGAQRRHDARDRQPAPAAGQHRAPRRRAVADPRPQQRAGQPDLRRQPPPDRGVAGQARRGDRHRLAARARARHGRHHRGDGG